MNTLKQIRPLMLAIGFLVHCIGQAQVTVPNNNSGIGDYVGCDNTSPFPLRIMQNDNWPIHFFTDTRFRMLLNESVTYPTLGSFPFVPADGFALITPTDDFLTTSPKGPFSRLHLAEGDGDNTQSIGYRPWQRNGITFTGNADQGYIGHKYAEELEDITDMVIQWSDNPGFEHADRMRFIFTSAYNELSSTGAASEEGLEGMRLWPKNFKEINVGVGDFFADGTDPTERLHVLDGRVRIEELPHPDFEALETFKVMVVDDAATPSDERGVVKWKELDDLLEADCEWTMAPSGNRNVSTAFGAASTTCPDDADAVGIGVDLGTVAATAKLDVLNNNFNFGLRANTTRPTALTNTGIIANVTGSSTVNIGVDVTVNGTMNNSIGIRTNTTGATGTSAYAGAFLASDNATVTVGAEGIAYNGVAAGRGLEGHSFSSATLNFGTFGISHSDGQTGSTRYHGAYGEVTGVNGTNQLGFGVYGRAPISATTWAGYFEGDVNVVGTGYYVNGLFVASDENLKTNIQPLDDPLTKVMQIQTHTYEMRVDEFPQMHLSAGEHAGIIAQELEQILPGLVNQTRISAEVDSLGVEVYPEVEYKAVNYTEIIPYLIGSIQQQQEIITSQNDRIDQLENAIANCCNPFSPGGEQALPPQQGGTPDLLNDRSMKVVPNPFQNETTIHYNLERGGRVQLMANSADGKQLQVLFEQVSESGVYQFNWHTEDLAAGMYYVTLLLDGEALTKRAVKIDR